MGTREARPESTHEEDDSHALPRDHRRSSERRLTPLYHRRIMSGVRPSRDARSFGHGRVRLAAVAALVALFLLPAIALAHPLGNFTINHYAGIRVAVDRIDLDVVID